MTITCNKDIKDIKNFAEEIENIVNAHKEPYINEYDFQYDLCKNIEKIYNAKIYREHKALYRERKCSIDFVIEWNKERIPVEVKYRPNKKTIYWEGLEYGPQKFDEEVFDVKQARLSSDVTKMICYIQNTDNKFPYGYCILLTNRKEWEENIKNDRKKHNVKNEIIRVEYQIDDNEDNFYLEICQINRECKL